MKQDAAAPFPAREPGYTFRIVEPGTKPTVHESRREEGESFRLLVVAAESVPADAIENEIRRHAGDRRPEVWIVAPAVVDTPFRHASGDIDEGIEEAGKRLEQSLEAARGTGAKTEGAVGDADPILAIEDALRRAPADEVLIVTHPEEQSRWMEEDLFERARHKLEPPLTHVVVEAGEARVTERSEGGAEPSEDVEFQSRSADPDLSYSGRDISALVVAIVGSLALFLIAANCVSEGIEEGFSHCVAELMIAGGMTLINLAHIVGLILFSSVGYRGPWERFIARLSLIGTPIALVAVIGISLIFG